MPKINMAAATLLIPLALVAGCSSNAGNAGQAAQGSQQTAEGGQQNAAQTQSGDNNASASPAADPAITPREASKDVKITECKLDNGSAKVVATVTNSGDKKAQYIIPVTVKQGDKTVDTLALLADPIEPGKEGTATMKGNKTGLKGEITCEAGEVSAV